METSKEQRKVFSALAWYAIGILLFFVSVAAVLKMIDLKVDFPAHTGVAAKITWEALRHPLTFFERNYYPVWHLLTWFTMNIFGCSVRSAAAAVTGGCIVGTWACAAFYFSRRYHDEEIDVARAASVLLMLVSPIWLPFFNPDILLGQGHPNLLHSPTHIMVRLTAFPCFACYAAVLDGIGRESASRIRVCKIIALSAFVLLATLSKPSFAQMFFPAIFLLVIFKIIKYRKIAILPSVAVLVSLAPVLLLMGFQAWLAFDSPNASDSGVDIAFLKMWARFSPNVFVSIMLAILFPLIVLLWSIRTRKVSTADVLAWTMCGVAATEAAFLIERGRRMWHGNLCWAWSLSLFFIWVVAIDRFILLTKEHVRKTIDLEQSWWFWSAVVVLSLHLVSGLCYLWRVLAFGVWR